MAGGIVSLRGERGTPCLDRGWRTPDPSPSRGLADLPSCKPQSWWALNSDDVRDVETLVNQSVSSSGTNPGRGRSQIRRCDQFSDAESEAVATTVSTSALAPAPAAFLVASRTPSPVPCPSVAQKERRYAKTVISRINGGPLLSSFSTICGESEAEGSFALDVVSPCHSLSSQPQGSDARTRDAPAGGSTMDNAQYTTTDSWRGTPIPPPPSAPPAIRELLGLPDTCPSVGSLNHPHGCADFCKYAKKSRGCKDGDACSRCHMCTRKKGNFYSFQGFRSNYGSGPSYSRRQHCHTL